MFETQQTPAKMGIVGPGVDEDADGEDEEEIYYNNNNATSSRGEGYTINF